MILIEYTLQNPLQFTVSSSLKTIYINIFLLFCKQAAMFVIINLLFFTFQSEKIHTVQSQSNNHLNPREWWWTTLHLFLAAMSNTNCRCSYWQLFNMKIYFQGNTNYMASLAVILTILYQTVNMWVQTKET